MKNTEDRYFFSRLVKVNLNTAQVINAIFNPVPCEFYKNKFSFFDGVERTIDGKKVVFAKLNVFDPESSIIVSNPKIKKDETIDAPNLRRASSRFVYIPNYQLVAFTASSDYLDEFKFPFRFSQIVKATYGDILIDCHLNTIASTSKFIEKLKKVSRIEVINSKVSPPNPLFGRLWKNLNDHLKKRDVDTLTISEVGRINGLKTTLVSELEKIEEGISSDSPPLNIVDASVAMAADGYGSSTIRGNDSDGKKISVKTNDSFESIDISKDAVDEEVYNQIRAKMEILNQKHGLSH